MPRRWVGRIGGQRAEAHFGDLGALGQAGAVEPLDRRRDHVGKRRHNRAILHVEPVEDAPQCGHAAQPAGRGILEADLAAAGFDLQVDRFFARHDVRHVGHEAAIGVGEAASVTNRLDHVAAFDGKEVLGVECRDVGAAAHADLFDHPRHGQVPADQQNAVGRAEDRLVDLDGDEVGQPVERVLAAVAAPCHQGEQLVARVVAQCAAQDGPQPVGHVDIAQLRRLVGGDQAKAGVVLLQLQRLQPAVEAAG